MAETAGLETGKFIEAYWHDRAPYDRGDMNATEYWNRLAERQLDPAEIKKLVDLDNRSWTHPSNKMIACVTAARDKGLRTALLSNLPAALRDALENDCPWLPPFDVRTYSCSVRKTKPDREIYEACVRDLGVKPPEIVFLDDRPENVEAAQKLGIHGLQFESPERAALDLSAQFGLNLGPHRRR